MWSVYRHVGHARLASYIWRTGPMHGYSPDDLAKLSSCACAPDRNPPPGFLAEAKLRARTRAASGPGDSASSRAAAARVDSFTTSNRVANVPGLAGGRRAKSAGR